MVLENRGQTLPINRGTLIDYVAGNRLKLTSPIALYNFMTYLRDIEDQSRTYNIQRQDIVDLISKIYAALLIEGPFEDFPEHHHKCIDIDLYLKNIGYWKHRFETYLQWSPATTFTLE